MVAGTTIGLDIGASSIRAAETRRSKGSQVLTNYGQVPLPDHAVQSGVIRDEKAVTAALRQLWSSTRFHGKRVVIGVNNPQVVVREMALSNLPADELRASLPFQVRDALPLPTEQALLDFHPLEDARDAETVRGLLIAAPKEPVGIAVRAVEKAGLHVARVDLASFALLRGVAQLDGRVEAVVDIGDQSTIVAVHVDGRPLIVRTVPRGGRELTQMLADRLGISPQEADALKCRIGLLPDEASNTIGRGFDLVAPAGEPPAASVAATTLSTGTKTLARPLEAAPAGPGPQRPDDRRPDLRSVGELIREAIRPLINEINSSFTYLNAGDRQASVDRLALAGGGAALPGLADELAERLSVAVSVVNPAMRLHDPRRGRHDHLRLLRPSAAVAIGLTLGAS